MAIINLWTWPKNKNDPCKMGRFQKLSDPPRITFFWLGLQDVIRNPAKYEDDMKNVLYIAYGLGITEA